MGDFGFKFKNIKVKLWLKNEIQNSKNEIVNPEEEGGEKVAKRGRREGGEVREAGSFNFVSLHQFTSSSFISDFFCRTVRESNV